MNKELTKDRLLKGIRLFVFLSVATAAVILFFTTSEDTIEQLKRISPLFLALTLLSVSLRFFFDIWRLRYIIEALGKELSWRGAFHFTMGGLPLGAITPGQVGGIPFQLYVCKREKILVPEGSAAIFTRGLLSAMVLPLFLIPIWYYRQFLTSGLMSAILKYLIVFYGIVAVVFFFLLTQTPWLKRKFGRKVKGIVMFKEVFTNEYIKRKMVFLKAYITSFLSLTFNVLTAPLLIKGLGIEAPFFEAMIIQVILTYAVNFMPTPGATGFAEGSAVAAFQHLMPKSVLGVFIVLWRFFTAYFGILVGILSITEFIRERWR
jgi:glycosyltransferase 2 family protein